MQTRHIFSPKNRQLDFHRALINCASALDHHGNERGMCFGFTMAWIEAILTNKTRGFLDKACHVIRLEERLKRGFPLTSFDDRLLWELKAFYDNIVLYQHSCVSSSVLEKKIIQLEVEQVATIAASDDLQSMGGFKKTREIHYGRFQKEEIGCFLKELQKKIQASQYKHPIAFLLGLKKENGGLHAVNISYYPATQSWQFMDVNVFPPKEPESNFETFLSQFTTSAYQFFSITAILPNQEDTETLERKIFELPLLGKNIDVNKMLHFGVYQVDCRVVEKLLSKGANSNVIDIFTQSPLLIAAKTRSLELVELLLRAGADIHYTDISGSSALMIAVQDDHVELVEMFLRAGADMHHVDGAGMTPLMMAAQNGQFAIIELLLRAGVDINQVTELGNTPLMTASESGNLAVVELFLRAGANMNFISSNGNSALLIAAHEGHVEVVDLLLRAGAYVNQANAHSITPLMVAVANQHIAVVELLLSAGANVRQKNLNGATALMIAAENGTIELVEILLRAGANPYQAPLNDEAMLLMSPLNVYIKKMNLLLKTIDTFIDITNAFWCAVKNGHVAVVDLLLRSGADIHDVGITGAGALLIAAECGHSEVVDILLKAGADMYQQNAIGATPFLMAAQMGHVDVVKVLLRAGTDINQVITGTNSAIVIAVKSNNFQMFELLLSQEGIDIGHIAQALFCAVLAGYLDMVQKLLEQHGIEKHMKRDLPREELYRLLVRWARQDSGIIMRIEAHFSAYPNQALIPISLEQIALILDHADIAAAVRASQASSEPLLKRSKIGC